ncbi:hypothetical protein Aperf_G00000112030 [Anoplocephala perfoliata]
MPYRLSCLLRSSLNCLRSTTCAGKLAVLATGKTHYKVLVTGGGSGGCAVAARLRDVIPARAVGVIEPEEHHYYQAVWTLVGAGIIDLPKTRIPMQEAIPNNAEWIRDRVSSFDPANNMVTTVGGKQITYDYLVMALGMTLRYDMIQGAQEALREDSRVCSNFSKDYVEKTFEAIRQFSGGPAIFTMPHTPIKCPGAPQKVMYLFEDYLARKNRKKEAQIHYFAPTDVMLSGHKYGEALKNICQKRGIECHFGQNLVEVDHRRSTAIMEDMETQKCQEYKYELLHLTPPMSAPAVVKTGVDLSFPESNGYVSVDPGTLRHLKYGNIFALGDCSSLPTSRTAAAISSQSHVLCENLMDVINGGSGCVAKYDGYTSCSLLTGYWKGILVELDYSEEPVETLPIDQSKERALFSWMKRWLLPALYWNGLIR